MELVAAPRAPQSTTAEDGLHMLAAVAALWVWSHESHSWAAPDDGNCASGVRYPGRLLRTLERCAFPDGLGESFVPRACSNEIAS
jgi:hypothetical protein